MSAVLLALGLIIPVAVLVWWWRPVDVELDEVTYRAATELHAIRRRLDVASFQTELKTDGAALLRELRGELTATGEEPVPATLRHE